jgi:hypothetical protein
VAVNKSGDEKETSEPNELCSVPTTGDRRGLFGDKKISDKKNESGKFNHKF